jgi:hypothetical protein
MVPNQILIVLRINVIEVFVVILVFDFIIFIIHGTLRFGW